jgi:malonyl-CoA/methylmalonyl-CoA synthetase
VPPLRPWTDHLPGASDVGDGSVDLSGTLPRTWSHRWASEPAAPLFCEPSHPSRWWSAGEFDAATRRAAGRLRGAGLLPGDRVIWSTMSSVASLAAHVGALRAGLVVVPANPALTERELTFVVRDCRPACAIVERDEQARWLRAELGEEVPIVGPALHLPDVDIGDLDRVDPDDPALVCYTSGTTGAPKGAVLRHANLAAGTASVVAAWRWAPDDRLVHALPVFHAHGLCVGVYGTLAAGASAVLLPGFDPAGVVDAIATHRGSLFFGVPTMYHRLLDGGVADGLRPLRLCVSGSAPLPAALSDAVAAAVGTRVLERYGMTETLMLVSNPVDGERRPGTVGFPLPGVELTLAGDGEILVRGPSVFRGYWERPEVDRGVFTPSAGDGAGPWFHTGDLGTDEDGYLVIRGRWKELIISGGFNVYPAEVEDVLRAHPAVAEVAVAGTPSPEWGEVVTAWIVPDGAPPTVEELAAFTEATLAPYKRPRAIRIVDELPRNAMGKVVRSRLGE